MRKIPTLFQRDENDRNRVTPIIAVQIPEHAFAYAKWDGTAAKFDGEEWWTRREVKEGKQAPSDFVLEEHDQFTGKQQGWVPVNDEPEHKWHRDAVGSVLSPFPETYELIGPHFQGNPHELMLDEAIAHKSVLLTGMNRPLDYTFIYEKLCHLPYEGVVWWADGKPIAKIKRRDFGLPWPKKDGQR
jgi:hypothetical protein